MLQCQFDSVFSIFWGFRKTICQVEAFLIASLFFCLVVCLFCFFFWGGVWGALEGLEGLEGGEDHLALPFLFSALLGGGVAPPRPKPSLFLFCFVFLFFGFFWGLEFSERGRFPVMLQGSGSLFLPKPLSSNVLFCLFYYSSYSSSSSSSPVLVQVRGSQQNRFLTPVFRNVTS